MISSDLWTITDAGLEAGCLQLPNLIASAPLPDTAQINTPLTFTSTITNNGGVSTGSGFDNVFQVAEAENGGGGISIIEPASSLASLDAGASANITSSSYIFTEAKTYSVRACADKNVSFVGTITESDEGDNCSDWVNVIVTEV